MKLTADPASDANIRFVLHPDHRDATLWHPGTCLVMCAAAAARLVVDVEPARANGSTAATVRIEAMVQSKPGVRPSQEPDHAGRAPDLADFSVRAHVAIIGDVSVGADEWLAGPAAPSRIEGISIDWRSKPRDLDVRYAVRTARPQAISGQMVESGGFAGTRGKALPIVGLTLEMSGPAAERLQFAAKMIFLGSPTMRVTGKRIVASGPTGREPLVGLQLGVEEVRAPAAERPAPGQLPRPSGRVRVFRSRTPEGQPAA